MSARMRRRAVYPGTFDPATNGHLSLIERALPLFDELIVAVATNEGKRPLFELEERMQLMRASVAGIASAKRIRVVSFSGLLADFVRAQKACAIIRGLRAVSDFEYEFQMALMNRELAREVETVFMMPALTWVYLSSSIVKDVATNGGDVRSLVPPPVYKALRKKIG